jgi:methionyl aminopeptidase
MIHTLLQRSPGEGEVRLKTAEERAAIARAGEVAARLLRAVAREIRPGTRTGYLDRAARSSVRTLCEHCDISGPETFPGIISVSVNDTAVHGIPGEYELRNGDLVSVDVALKVDGWYGDCALTVIAGTASPRMGKLLEAAREATRQGISSARAGGRIGDIGAAISRTARRYGARVIDVFVGHGVGCDLHEEPVVYPLGENGTGQPLVPGMVLTVEPVLTFGSGEVELCEDGWSYRTVDRAPTALFEHTLALLPDRTLVLTAEAEGKGAQREYRF